MSVKKEQPEKNKIYFCTFTCYNWISLFQLTSLYDHIYKWFNYINEKYQNKIIGFVIMPNHIHLLIYVSENSITINKLIGNGKRFMAYEIVKRLTTQKNYDVLNRLKKNINIRDSKNGKLHHVFTPSFDCKLCFNDKMIIEKLNYIHNNPISKKWSLTENAIDYKHSSARFYEIESREEYPITHYRDI